jgi:hypothetical protein
MAPTPNHLSRFGRTLLAACLAVLVTGCSTFHGPPDSPQKAFVPDAGDDLLSRYAPAFVVGQYEPECNRVGTPSARINEADEEEVYVDPDRPAIYAERQMFYTDRGTYTNLVYRVHFQRVPFPHVTWGKNPGILAIVTLDGRERPVLITTVSTCGCYNAVIPTGHLPRECLPEDWSTEGQKVHGEKLPGMLDYSLEGDAALRPVIELRDETHRVRAVSIRDVGDESWPYRTIPTPLRPMAELEALPVPGAGTTSFFHESGLKRGLVRNNRKILEMLVFSWWAFDLDVGRDRKFCEGCETGQYFYTTLKFWARDDSDMQNFAGFLDYWGWRL